MGHTASSCKVHALATNSGHSEAVWSEISRHLTIKQWAKVSGTCKASWFLPPPHIKLPLDLKAAGYTYVLKRCHAASSISAAVWGKQASDAFKCALGASLRLKNVKELTVTDGDECSVAHRLYEACPNLKAVAMRTRFCAPLYACSSLRHLDLETCMNDLLQGVNWQAFPQLEILRLCHHRAGRGHLLNYKTLDLSGLSRLRCLRIVNWSPNSITLTAGCQVHAVWQPVRAHKKDPRPCAAAQTLFSIQTQSTHKKWLLSPCWTASGMSLVSLHIECPWIMDDEEADAINAILRHQERLELLNVSSHWVGIYKKPLILPLRRPEGMAHPLRVNISTLHGCWLLLDNTNPVRKPLALNTKGNMHISILGASEDPQQNGWPWTLCKGCLAITLGEGSSLHQQMAKAVSDASKQNKPSRKRGRAAAQGACGQHVSCWCFW